MSRVDREGWVEWIEKDGQSGQRRMGRADGEAWINNKLNLKVFIGEQLMFSLFVRVYRPF